MVSKRNGILDLLSYLNSLGIIVNIGKNKARGHKGFFKVVGQNYRIDINKALTDDEILRTLVHEFAHFIHYNKDTTLKSLDFIFNNYTTALQEELLSVTVDSIPKSEVEPLFRKEQVVADELLDINRQLITEGVDLDTNYSNSELEKLINEKEYSYLLKYDKVKVVKGFSSKLYSIDNLNADTKIILYLKLKSKQRLLKRIKSKISRLNRYYNLPTELFARSFEKYVLKREVFKEKYPLLFSSYETVRNAKSIPILTEFIDRVLQII